MAYVSVQDIRNEGVSDAYSDAVIEHRIALAEETFEQLTHRPRGAFSVSVGQSLKLDGTGKEILPLPGPPASETAISLVQIDGEDLNAANWELVVQYNRDYRQYPRLRYIDGTWPKGSRNITVAGDFGFVDWEGDPAAAVAPLRVRDAICRIVVEYLDPIGDLEAQKERRIVEEQLKNYRYRLSEAGQRGHFGDPFIDNIIEHYKPMVIRVL